ncbi:MAG: UvrD-helicase domain-containing protein, partial [Gammaproteobacteria bacterium]|nr:UvrD-helicase domain-containing protein [Gammaproteobacteria bacterium]
MSKTLHHLNSEQLAAVTLKEGNALILAGAGTGKTTVLTSRIAWLLENGLAYPEHILAVTFTNKGAQEILSRLQSQVLTSHRMWVGTFHGLCHRMLRIHVKMTPWSDEFQIMDTQDQKSALKRLYKNYAINEVEFPLKDTLRYISNQKEQGIRSLEVIPQNVEDKKYLEIYSLYEKQCLNEGLMDFAELLLSCYKLLQDHAEIRADYQNRFRHILIDEFQDTSLFQYKWIKLLCGKQSQIFVVGDDDQSIYGFRGARVENMRDYLKEFHIDNPIKLEDNYRSQFAILEAANGVISHNDHRLGKTLRAAQTMGDKVLVQELNTGMQEAQWVADKIRSLVRTSSLGASIKYSDIAVLYRNNSQSQPFESTLLNHQVPYKIYGGLKFYDRAEIKNTLAYLRVIANPK